MKQSSQMKYKYLPLCGLIIFRLNNPAEGQNLSVQTKQKVLPDSDIAVLVINSPCLRIGQTQDWLKTVWL